MKESKSDNQPVNVFEELEDYVFNALKTYSNVHRGSGQNSLVTSRSYDQARNLVLDYLGLSAKRYTVIFCTKRRADLIVKNIDPGKYRILSSLSIGLALGVYALAVEKSALPENIPFLTGGGTARLVSPGWVIWSKAPERYEAGTPAIINILAFTRALTLLKESGKGSFTMVNNTPDAGQILMNDELDRLSGNELLNGLRGTLIGHDIEVSTTEGMKRFINLDNAASTRTFIPVWNAAWNTMHQPVAVHKEVVQEVRELVSEFTGAPLSDFDILFTSNTTEAINLVAESLSKEAKDENVVVNTILEHNSNELPWRASPNMTLLRLKTDTNGFADLNELENLLIDYNQRRIYGEKRISVVTVCGASNVLGTFSKLEAISLVVHKYGARLLVDAAQMIAHRKIEISKCDIDYLAFSAHKIYAPFGTGVLIARKGLLSFSNEEIDQINLSGEENSAGIAALGKSLLLLKRIGMDLIQNEELELTRYAIHKLAGIKGIKIYGIDDPGSQDFNSRGGVISFSLGNKVAHNVSKKLAARGAIGVRSGCHCAHLLVKFLVGVPPALEKFQGFLLKLFPKLSLPGIVRISVGIENNEKDIDALERELRSFD